MSFLAYLESAAAEAARLKSKKPKPHNPKPAGVARPGSASALVLEYLGAVPGFRTKTQITHGINRNRQAMNLPPISIKAVDWALIFLRSQKRIDAVEDSRRNKRYLRYRIAKESNDGHN